MAKKLTSAFTDDMDHCFISGTAPVERHHIFGSYNRKRSEQYGYVVPLAPVYHPNGVHAGICARTVDVLLKKMAQLDYENKYGTRDDFRAEFGKSYL